MLNDGKSVMLIPAGKTAQGNLSEWLKQEQIQLQDLTADVSEINYVNYLHPITSILTKEMFNKVRIDKMWKSTTKGFSPLIGTSTGSILSIKNKLLLSSINFEPDWTNLAYQSVFPVLFYNIANYLGRYNPDLRSYEVGAPFTIMDKGRLKCRLPNGELVPLLVEQKNAEIFTQTNWQGHYFVYSQDNQVKEIISYNSSRLESNLSRLSQKKIKNIETKFAKIHFLNDNNWKKKF